MNLKWNGMTGKLALGAVVACGVCVVPLAVPVLMGIAGGSALVAGLWGLGAVLFAGVLAIVLWRWRLRGAPQEQHVGCCGKET